MRRTVIDQGMVPTAPITNPTPSEPLTQSSFNSCTVSLAKVGGSQYPNYELTVEPAAGNTSDCTNFVIQTVTATNSMGKAVNLVLGEKTGASNKWKISITPLESGKISFNVVIADSINSAFNRSLSIQVDNVLTVKDATTITLPNPTTVSGQTPAPSCQIIANKSSGYPGEPILLTIMTVGVITELKLGSLSLTATGGQPVIVPLVSGNLTAIVTGPAGSFTCSVFYTIVPLPPAPKCEITLSQSSGLKDQSITAKITFTGLISSITFNEQTIEADKNTITLIPTKSMDIKGSVTGPGGSTSCSAPYRFIEQLAQSWPRCPNGHIIEFGAQGSADAYCISIGYTKAASFSYFNNAPVNTVVRSPGGNNCDCYITGNNADHSLQYTTAGNNACDGISTSVISSLVCER